MSRRFPGGFWPAVGGGEPKKSEAQKRVDKQVKRSPLDYIEAGMAESLLDVPRIYEDEEMPPVLPVPTSSVAVFRNGEGVLAEPRPNQSRDFSDAKWTAPPSKGPFAERLKEWREKRGMSQKELMEATGMTQAALSRLEAGRSKPRAKTLSRLAAALKIDVSLLEE